MEFFCSLFLFVLLAYNCIASLSNYEPANGAEGAEMCIKLLSFFILHFISINRLQK